MRRIGSCLRIIIFLWLLVSVQPIIGQIDISRSEVAPGWARTSVNVAIFRQNSIATHNNDQYIAFYDTVGNMVLGKRNLGSGNWTLHKSQYAGNVMDAHNVISIMVDGDGFLHVAWDHHGHPLNYCRSVAPGSLILDRKIPMTGKYENKITYPQFFRKSDGDLLFAYRDGSSGNGNLVLNSYDRKTRSWRQLHSNLIDGEGERNAYWQMYLDINDMLHLSWVWRETGDVATNHDMCYARSPDGGFRWEQFSGKSYTLPINKDNAEYAMRIPQNSDLINQTSMTADHESHPFIATYYQKPGDQAPQIYVVFNLGSGWKHMKAGNRMLDFDLGGTGTRSIPISRPVILHTGEKGSSYIHVIYREEELGDKACMLTRKTGVSGNWETILLSKQGLDRWEPTYDTELWKNRGLLHLFIQKAGQGSGEKAVDMPPQTVRVLEINF